MITANFKAYASYVTDSLNQWDLNQVLQVTGLNLTVVPEVHFSNANIDRAIARQATMTDHVVSVGVPNSLLQDPLRIYAHIGIYEGDTFKVVELVEIPVIPRKRPADYQIQDADGEIYSFKQLENAIANMTTKAEAGAISARIDTIVANANETDGNSELVDLRVGADGKTYASAGAAVRGLYMPSMATTIDAGNYAELLPSANVVRASVYKLLFATGSTEIPADLPFTEWPGGIATLITSNPERADTATYVTQVLHTLDNVYYRYTSTGFSFPWHAMVDKREPLLSKATTIMESNYSTLLPDVNKVTDATVYKLLFAEGSTAIPANLPFTEWEGVIATLITFNSREPGTSYYGAQLLITTENVYYRYGSTEYQGWICMADTLLDRLKNNTLTVSSGGSILAGLKKCYANGYTRLVVEAGVYDIIAEYESYYGSSYFTNYAGYSGQADKFTRGLWLQDIEVVFSPGARVVCKYTGDNDNVPAYFSAFATGNNAIIDGLHLDAEGLRYGIHADYNSGTDLTTFKVKNCDLRHYKSDANAQAIGAGLGVHVLWEIENTVFRSQSKTHVFRVHNNVDAAAQSKVVVKNCYIDGPGYFRFNSYAESEAITDILVTGCSYVTAPMCAMEVAGATTPENMKLTAWNNEIRNS